MGVLIDGIIATGRFRVHSLSTEPIIFEGGNVNLILPLQFAGDSNTFVSSIQNDIPISFAQNTIQSFSNTSDRELSVSFAQNTIQSFSNTSDRELPLQFSGSAIN